MPGETNDGLHSPSYTSKQLLELQISGINNSQKSRVDELLTSADNNYDNGKENDEVDDVYQNDLKTEWNARLENINQQALNEAKMNDQGNHTNAYWNTNFAKHFLRLCQTILLWSCVACKHFGVEPKPSSTANVESYFSDTKNCLSQIIPSRLDKFIIEHIDMIDGMIKNASLKYVKSVNIFEQR